MIRLIEGFPSPSVSAMLRSPPGSLVDPRFSASRGEKDMQDNCGVQPLLGSVLVEQGAVEGAELDDALETQVLSGKRLGEILIDLGVVCRPELDRAVATQSGVDLDEEAGFGSGLRAAIERRHRVSARRCLLERPSPQRASNRVPLIEGFHIASRVAMLERRRRTRGERGQKPFDEGEHERHGH